MKIPKVNSVSINFGEDLIILGIQCCKFINIYQLIYYCTPKTNRNIVNVKILIAYSESAGKK